MPTKKANQKSKNAVSPKKSKAKQRSRKGTQG
jgi:hypothetical protein